MNRRADMLENNNPKSCEKKINKKEEQSHKLTINKMSVEKSHKDNSANEVETQSVDEGSPTTEKAPSIRVFRCPTVVPRTIVKYSKIAIPTEKSYLSNMDTDEESIEQKIAECPTPKNATRYNMNLPRRGKCIIFNHEHFNLDNGDRRWGTTYDVRAIEETFAALGFEILIYNDLLWYEVDEEIGKLSKDDYKDCACICIFILTHGSHGGKLSARDASYPFVSIWTPFTADKCSTLFGKPKIFFTQTFACFDKYCDEKACRGQTFEESVRGKSNTDFDEQSYSLPSQADFLFAYSTTEGSYSIREEQRGTWYIQTLCKMINKHWKEYDLMKILTLTARAIGIEKTIKLQTMKEKKQMPVVTTTLTRDIYFAAPPQYDGSC